MRVNVGGHRHKWRGTSCEIITNDRTNGCVKLAGHLPFATHHSKPNVKVRHSMREVILPLENSRPLVVKRKSRVIFFERNTTKLKCTLLLFDMYILLSWVFKRTVAIWDTEIPFQSDSGCLDNLAIWLTFDRYSNGLLLYLFFKVGGWRQGDFTLLDSHSLHLSINTPTPF